VNVNAALYPFTSGTSGFIRTIPLQAVLGSDIRPTNAPPLSPTALTNISLGTLASKGRKFGPTSLQTNNLYLIPEQIAEIAGVADTGEQSEVDFRPTLPFLTTQSSTFEVYSIGQKISQSRNNDIRVQGQSRSTSLVEWRDGAAKVLSTQEPW
jgi:hypothetical protein